MSAAFSHTLRSLDADRGSGRTLSLCLLPLLAGWISWLTCSQVAIYEVAPKVRLEVQGAVHPVTAVVAGQVVESHLRLGREVRAGEVLLILDSETQRRELAEKRVRRLALLDRLAPLAREIEAERQAMTRLDQARLAARDEAQALAAEAAARALVAGRHAETSRRLQGRNAISSEELGKDIGEADARRSAADALRLASLRVESDRGLQESERQARLIRLEREVVELTGQAAIEAAAIERLEHEIALREVRAPVDGRIGEVAEVHAGTVVQVAQRLAAVVPAGERRAVAWFPVAAVGRLRPNQPARLRMDGFPWTQYGTLTAAVTDIGSEPQDGRIRVELSLAETQDSSIPIEHGLTGTAEVEVERLAPAVLVLRAAGQVFATR